MPDTYTRLDDRIRLVIAALNEEIQIAIGSVQVQDAKKMRRLTELTVRLTESAINQARWTIVLTFLAAFYLPMTLITGISGMNIKEISEDNEKNGPSKWWVVFTWAVAFFCTASCIIGYAIVSWWRSFEKEWLRATKKLRLLGQSNSGERT